MDETGKKYTLPANSPESKNYVGNNESKIFSFDRILDPEIYLKLDMKMCLIEYKICMEDELYDSKEDSINLKTYQLKKSRSGRWTFR